MEAIPWRASPRCRLQDLEHWVSDHADEIAQLQDELASVRDAVGPAQIAYFSPEFGVAAQVPQYSGGLGILAGDHLKSRE